MIGELQRLASRSNPAKQKRP